MLSDHLLSQSMFWTSVVLLAYVYAGYPLVIGMLGRKRRAAPVATAEYCPSVSMIISAFNERDVIRAKLENALGVDYPKGCFEIVVVSDCSTDGTDDIVREFAGRGVRLVRQSQRAGKTSGLNLAVPMTGGTVIVFSDANAIYQPDAIRHLVGHFADAAIGFVVGSQRYLKRGAPAAQAEGLYWRLETWIKLKESQFHSALGGDGAMYAIRRELYTPLKPADINDFLNPLQIVDRGYRGIFEPQAICFEEPSESIAQEFRRKTRIVSRSLKAVWRARGVLNPLRDARHWFMLISHKVLRWFAPVLIVMAFGSSVWLWQQAPVYRVAMYAQLAFAGLATIGWVLRRRGDLPGVFTLPYYFCVVNLAALVGILKVLTRDVSATWSTVREVSTSR